MRRYLLVALLLGLVVLGGCVGATGPEEDNDTTLSNDSIDSNTTDGENSEASGDDVAVSESVDWDEDPLEIHHIDVGQGDAALLVAPSGETMLIDSGDWRDYGATVIQYLEANGIDRIDHLVSTHAHADQIGGHEEVIDHFEGQRDGVGAVYDSGVSHTSQTYQNYLDAVERHDIDLFEVRAGDEIPFGENISATVLNPTGEEDEQHTASVTLSIAYEDFHYFTSGDAEATTERRIVDDNGALDADVYQAGHHGSSTSSSDELISALDPIVAVISSAIDSQYGHPHEETLDRFAANGIETYWTGVHGDIVVRTNGTQTAVSTEHEATTDPDELATRKAETSESLAPTVGGLMTPAAPVHG
jgi:competence protein ComEC